MVLPSHGAPSVSLLWLCQVVLSRSSVHFCLRYGSGGDITYKFLANLGNPQTAPTRVFADNETCISWSEGSVGVSERA